MAYNTQLRLYAGINLDRNYTDICDKVDLQSLELYRIDTINNLRFIRNDQRTGSVQLEYYYGSAIECNYMAFINTDYSNRPFFAFIDKVLYISDKNIEIQFTIDLMSTYWDDWTRNTCMVVREHVNEDYIGASRTAESISADDYTTAAIYDIDVSPDKVVALFTEAWDPRSGEFQSPAVAYGYRPGTSVPALPFVDNLPYLLWRVVHNYGYEGFQELIAYYSNYVAAGKGGDLVTVFTYNHRAGDAAETEISAPKITYIGTQGNSYTPRNKKVLQYPFVKLTLTNLAGSVVELRQEDFDNTINIAVTAVASDRGQAFAYPQNYCGIVDNTDYGLLMDNYPTFPMTVDSFQTYLAQHEVSMTLGAVGGAIGSISSVATGNPLGAIAGAGNLINQVSQLATAKTVPDSVVGRSGGNLVNFKLDNFRYLLEVNTVPVELAKSIDNYFDKYGYAVNELKLPNLTGRPYYNYVQVQGSVGHGNVPADIMDVINAKFNAGVTIWHDLDYIGNYALNNAIS